MRMEDPHEWGCSYKKALEIRPENQRPNFSQVSEFDDVPVIDIGAEDIGAEDQARIVNEVHTACKNFDFFQVTNQAVFKDIVKEIQKLAHEFFKLRIEEEMKLYGDDPTKTMRLSTSFNFNKEEVDNWRDCLGIHCWPLEEYVLEWPSNLPSFNYNSDRVRTCVTNKLMMEFQALRQKIMTEYKEIVGRCYYNVTGELLEDDVIDKIISNGAGEGEILSHAIQEHCRGKVLETMMEIQGRDDVSKEIERSLLKLHQVLLDMSVIVEGQGEQMDNIEHHLVNSSHYVQDGNKNLKKAKDYQRSSWKCMCFGIIALLLIIIVIVLLIIASFSHF